MPPVRSLLLAIATALLLLTCVSCSGSDNGASNKPDDDTWDEAACEAEGGHLRCVDLVGTECSPDLVGDECICECRIPTAGPADCEELGGVPFCIGDKTGLICWEDADDVECACRCTVGSGVIGASCESDDDCLDVLVCAVDLGACVRKCFEDRHCNAVSCVDATYCSID